MWSSLVQAEGMVGGGKCTRWACWGGNVQLGDGEEGVQKEVVKLGTL